MIILYECVRVHECKQAIYECERESKINHLFMKCLERERARERRRDEVVVQWLLMGDLVY